MMRQDHARATDSGPRHGDAHFDNGGRSLRAESDATLAPGISLLNLYLTSTHPFVVAVRDNLVSAYEAGLLGRADRRRKMKAADRENLKVILGAVLANLAKAVIEGRQPPSVAVSLRAAKQRLRRYDRPKFHRLPEIVEELATAGTDFTLEKSAARGTASTLTPSPGFAETLGRFRFDPSHFAQAPRETAVWLVRNEKDHVDGTRSSELIDYDSTPETERYEAEMRTINAALRSADMTITQAGCEAPIFAGLRDLRRQFNLPPALGDAAPRFDLGGRLFGGWWLNLPRSRRDDIRLDGEPIADLDFSGMFLRLAYLDLGLEPPAGDLYADVLKAGSGSRWRAGVKTVANAMLWRSTPMVRLPKAAKAELPAWATCTEVRSAILGRHRALGPIFETGAGYRLMFTESQILIAAMLDLIGQDVTAALPMHDGIMVPASKAELAEAAMGAAAEKIVGFRLPVARKA